MESKAKRQVDDPSQRLPTVILRSGQEEPPSPVATFRLLPEGIADEDFDDSFLLRQPVIPEVDLDLELSEMGISISGSEPAEGDGSLKNGSELTRLRDCGEEFRIGALLGKGGQGEVFNAYQYLLGRTVALKRAGSDPQVQRDFFKEAFTSAQLDHPNIVPVYELGVLEHQGKKVPVLAMKRVDGATWSSLLKMDREWREDGLDEYLSRHIPILLQVINAVAFAHSKQIIHRDLKPSQVMVGHYGEVFLLDWGLAVYLGEPSRDSPHLPSDTRRLFTRESATSPAGTPAYMSPEQALASTQGLGRHTDIYLLGAILYELLTGTPPHAERTVGAAVESARRNLFLPIPDSAPPELRHLAERCMATDPAQRPGSALEVKAALEQYLTGSSRKIDSRRLVNEVRNKQTFDGYEGLSEASRHLSQAMHLWPENPELPEQQQRLLALFVEAAIEERHFQLAYLQASRIPDPELSESLQLMVMNAQEQALASLPRPTLLTPRRLTALCLVYLFITIMVSGVLYYTRITVMGEVKDKVRSVANLAAREMDWEDLIELNRNPSMTSPEFHRVLNRMNSFRRANADVRYIYAYRPLTQISPRTWRVIADADPLDIDTDGDGLIGQHEKGNPPGSLYEEGIPAMLEAFQRQITTSAILTDEWGVFLSGFSPVVHPETGESVAIVGVDVRLSAVEERLRSVNRMGFLAGALLALLLTGALFAWFYSRDTLRMVRQLEEEIRYQSRNLGERSIYLG